MLDVMLVDDEAAGRRTLRDFCALESDVRILGEYGDGRAAWDAIRAEPPHVIFLDVRLETMDGMALVRALRQPLVPLIVFVSAYQQYALEAFELSAVDYLLKPFDRGRFRCTIERIRRRIEGETAVQRRDALDTLMLNMSLGSQGRVQVHQRVLVGLGSCLQMLDVELIEMASSARSHVMLTVGQETYNLRGTLHQAEQLLGSLPLLRISRSSLVNMNHVRKVSRTARGDFILVLSGGLTITSSERYRDLIREQFERFKVPPE